MKYPLVDLLNFDVWVVCTYVEIKISRRREWICYLTLLFVIVLMIPLLKAHTTGAEPILIISPVCPRGLALIFDKTSYCKSLEISLQSACQFYGDVSIHWVRIYMADEIVRDSVVLLILTFNLMAFTSFGMPCDLDPSSGILTKTFYSLSTYQFLFISISLSIELFLYFCRVIRTVWCAWRSFMMTSSKGNIFRVTGHLVQGIHRSPLNSQHKGQWRGALMFSLIYAWINAWVNNGGAGDL